MGHEMTSKAPMYCETCGIEIHHPNRRFCYTHRRTQKEYMDEKKAKADKRCPKCGVQIYHNTDTCWKCRPHSIKGKKIVRKPKPVITPKSTALFPVSFKKEQDPHSDDEIRAFANRATEKILAKLGATENQIKYQLKQAKISAGMARTQMIVPTAEQTEHLNHKRKYRLSSEMCGNESSYTTY